MPMIRAETLHMAEQEASDRAAARQQERENEGARIARLEQQLERANRIIGWMMPYIGNMCPPSNGIYDLNIHCCENRVPEPGDETKGPSIRQHTAGARPTGVTR